MSINRYNFSDLLDAAIAFDAPQEAIDALGAWFERYGNRYWNGECYDASLPGEPSGTRELYYLYRYDKKCDELEEVGYTFDSSEHWASLDQAVADGWNP